MQRMENIYFSCYGKNGPLDFFIIVQINNADDNDEGVCVHGLVIDPLLCC